jgi:hypothetical protein
VGTRRAFAFAAAEQPMKRASIPLPTVVIPILRGL